MTTDFEQLLHGKKPKKVNVIFPSLVVQLVKNPPAMQETWVLSLGWEDALKKRKATHSIFWPGEFHGLVQGVAKSWTRLRDFQSIVFRVET